MCVPSHGAARTPKPTALSPLEVAVNRLGITGAMACVDVCTSHGLIAKTAIL